MTRTPTQAQAQGHGDGRPRQAERQHRHVEVRRVAVVQPESSHFNLVPVRAGLAAMRG